MADVTRFIWLFNSLCHVEAGYERQIVIFPGRLMSYGFAFNFCCVKEWRNRGTVGYSDNKKCWNKLPATNKRRWPQQNPYVVPRVPNNLKMINSTCVTSEATHFLVARAARSYITSVIRAPQIWIMCTYNTSGCTKIILSDALFTCFVARCCYSAGFPYMP